VRADKRLYPNLLIVEGQDDLHSVVGLMQHRIPWSTKPKEWLIYIEVGNSVDEILATGYLTTEVKARHIQTLGVVLDADVHADGRYQRIEQLMSSLFPTLPQEIPRQGLIVENLESKRFGAWLMPDNKNVGSLETFLKYLVPEQQGTLWQQACTSVATARANGAACHDSHITKANLYTWLAWQEPPGQSPGLALTQKILNPHSPHAEPFVAWFKELYHLP